MGARKRSLDPAIWSDEGFLELSDSARLLFVGLISNADDEGRGPAMAKSLKARIFPGDDEKTSENIHRMLAECMANTNTLVYLSTGSLYYALLKWKDYQKVDHPQPSTIPTPSPETLSTYFSERSPNAQESFALINQLINQLINEIPESSPNAQAAAPSGGASMPPAGAAGRKDEIKPETKRRVANLFKGLRVEGETR